MPDQESSYIRKVITTTFIIALIVAGIVLLIYAIHFFFLVFAGILFAVMLRAMTNWIHRLTRLPKGLALALANIIFFGVIILTGVIIAPIIRQQALDMSVTLPAAIGKLEEQLEKTPWGERALNEVYLSQDKLLPNMEELISRARNIFTSTIGTIANVMIIIVVGIFFAVAPMYYQRSFVRLFPPRHRTRLWDVMEISYQTLKWWIFGKLLTMVVVGVLCWLGLAFLGIRMALVLAVIAFFLDFIPHIGPILAAVPAVLVALLDGPMAALYVVILYVSVQSFESYVVSPIVFQQTVSVSPVATLLSIVLFGILVGPIGVILAAPLVAILQIIIKELYIKDYLEKD
ncbi:AI-2E family transporter [Botryobacter ruber]|uniref:AI-2E family transporter n=1 Tax=Botryobacter ruber TaxID=2171629 RepID=UPI000E0BA1FB|nr:AI-2E family transporter [Botryobacter ruber]